MLKLIDYHSKVKNQKTWHYHISEVKVKSHQN